VAAKAHDIATVHRDLRSRRYQPADEFGFRQDLPEWNANHEDGDLPIKRRTTPMISSSVLAKPPRFRAARAISFRDITTHVILS
jgi:hypothetical protein